MCDAIAKRVEEIAEAAKTAFRLRSAVTIPSSVGMRSPVCATPMVHDYGDVDLDLLSDVVDVHLPRLVTAIDRILEAPAEAADLVSRSRPNLGSPKTRQAPMGSKPDLEAHRVGTYMEG